MNNEITFIADCEICGKKNKQCRNHHLIPRRLLKILRKSKARKWWKMTVIACDKCNRYLHPENVLYQQIMHFKEVVDSKSKGL